MSEEREYRVIWTIEVDGKNPEDAARKARQIQLDTASTATVYDVVERIGTCKIQRVDLSKKKT